MNIYLVEYELDFKNHQKYFLNEESADNYARKIITNIKDKIFNEDVVLGIYEKNKYDIELRDMEELYTNDFLFPSFKFLEVVDNNIIKRNFNDEPIIDYLLLIDITDKDNDEPFTDTYIVKIKTIEVIER